MCVFSNIFMKCMFFKMQNYITEKSLKIFFKELKKFCNTFCSDFSILFNEYSSLINILMLVIFVKWQLYTQKKCHFKMLSCQHCVKIKIKLVYHKSVRRQSARNGILPSYITSKWIELEMRGQSHIVAKCIFFAETTNTLKLENFFLGNA